MVRLNPNFDKLTAGYLFPEISRRVKKFQEENPAAEVIKLGIGNTTEPLAPVVVDFIAESAKRLGFSEGYDFSTNKDTTLVQKVLAEADYGKYTGYGDEQGNTFLRHCMAQWYKDKMGVSLEPDEIFISDGAKCDGAHIGEIFAIDSKVAVEDPSYPVPVDSNVIDGRTGGFNHKTGQYEGLVYLPCTEENSFFPEVPGQRVDLIYLIRPNNPTGAVATKEQLKKFVDFALENNSFIIFDSAYSPFVADSRIPRSIYEIDRADECAIETGSFSKWAGFTGVRGAWTVVPNKLRAADGEWGKPNRLWNRLQCTEFNGASITSQAGMLGVLTPEGQEQCQRIINFYMGNATIIKRGLRDIGLKVFGGQHSPYVWAQTPNEMDSWEYFDTVLRKAHIVCTPGGGFGPSGRKYVRFSAFQSGENIEKAVESMQKNLG